MKISGSMLVTSVSLSLRARQLTIQQQSLPNFTHR